MTDLTFCYLHMTQHDLDVLDTIGTPNFLKGEVSDGEVDIPPHMIPPAADDSDVLPSQVHPSYPYGNPLNVKHPAARPRRPYDPSSRALFEDMGYAGGGVNGTLRWKDLALERLIPVDEARDLAEKAVQARKLASGASSNHPPPPAPQPQPAEEPDEDEDDDNNENENENENGDNDEDNDENQGDSSPEEDDS